MNKESPMERLFQPLPRYGERFADTRTRSKIAYEDLLPVIDILFTFLKYFPFKYWRTECRSLLETLKKIELNNYKNTIKNINTINTRTYGTSVISFNCTNSKHLNHHQGHLITSNLITGDLQIIKDKQFCKIICKGPNYREPKTINLGKKSN